MCALALGWLANTHVHGIILYINGYTTNQCFLISAAPSMLLRNPVIYLTSYHTSPSGPVQAFCNTDRLHFPPHSSWWLLPQRLPLFSSFFKQGPSCVALILPLSILLVLGSKIFWLVLQQMFQSFPRSLLCFASQLQKLSKSSLFTVLDRLSCKLNHCLWQSLG